MRKRHMFRLQGMMRVRGFEISVGSEKFSFEREQLFICLYAFI